MFDCFLNNCSVAELVSIQQDTLPLMLLSTKEFKDGSYIELAVKVQTLQLLYTFSHENQVFQKSILHSGPGVLLKI